MRLSEKTLELNICSQASQYVSGVRRLMWFGLTQKQEARAGFDACVNLGGRLLIFQFKASNRTNGPGERIFHAPHHQVLALRARTRARRRSVFFAFPLVGNTHELRRTPDLVPQTWLVDVASLSALSVPRKSNGQARRNGSHNVYVRPGIAIFRSDPVKVDAIRLDTLLQQDFQGADGIPVSSEGGFESFWQLVRPLSAGTRGLILW